MSDTQQTEATEQEPEGVEKQQEQQTFTQADVDKILADRLRREREKFKDYDDLKAKAGEAKTAEDRLAELEKRYTEAENRALRANVASEYGISAEDRDLFLTGEDEETLTAQAKRLADRDSERKKRSNHVPREGSNPKPSETEEREVTRRLFGRD